MTLSKDDWHVIELAVLSRIAIFCLIVFSGSFGIEYDSSSTVWMGKSIVTKFIRWDAVHFLAIAQNGYQFEQQFAFFPGLPLVLNGLTRFVIPNPSLQQWLPAMAWTGILFTNCCFVGAAWTLFR